MDLVSGIRHWRGRRELNKLIGKSTGRRADTAALLSETMEILEHCPELAGERFPHYSLSNKMSIYPLSFLLMNGASLGCIAQVHSYFPMAVARKVTQKSAATDYPLHLACVLGGASEELILFLANAYPEAVTIKNSSGSLPIHVLLRNRRHVFTQHEIKTLMDHYENIRGPFQGTRDVTSVDNTWKIAKGDWREGNDDFGAILSLAVRNGNVDKHILDFLVSRFPYHCCDAFYLGRVTPDFSVGFFLRQNTNYTMTEPRIRSLCALLPCLKIFSCTPKNWSTPAFLLLMTELCRIPLVELTISFPPSLFREDASPALSLQRALEENTALRRLHVDFPAFCKTMQVEQVEAAAKKGFRTCLRYFLLALRNNNALKVCRLSGDLVPMLDSGFRLSEFWPRLADLLQNHNTTLESLAAGPFQHEYATTDMGKVEYWTRLNQHGRARLRNPSISVREVVNLLAAAQRSMTQQQNDLLIKVGILYGLLLDSPSAWARSAAR